MKKLLCLAILIFCSGCAPSWILKYEPTTDAERKAVAAHVEGILSATPRTLSGHDQDWDDAIMAANRAACQALCRPTLWEYQGDMNGGQYTGRWKYAEELK